MLYHEVHKFSNFHNLHVDIEATLLQVISSRGKRVGSFAGEEADPSKNHGEFLATSLSGGSHIWLENGKDYSRNACSLE